MTGHPKILFVFRRKLFASCTELHSHCKYINFVNTFVHVVSTSVQEWSY